MSAHVPFSEEQRYIDLQASCRRYHAKIERAMDELMRKVGGENEQPPPLDLIDLFERHGLGLWELSPKEPPPQ